MRALHTAATGLQAQTLNIDVISNNIANLTTTSFKRQRAEFQDLLYQSQERVGTNSSDSGTIVPTGIQVGLGVSAGAVYRIHEQGSLTQTSSPLDIAIRGKGFFSVELPTGEIAYTRAGSFQLNGDGEIVTSEGYLVSPGITVPDDAIDITINESGEVQATMPNQTQPQLLGQLEITDFVNPAGLDALGDNLLKETEASGAPIVGIAGEDGIGTLLQGFLESSNVNPVTELTTLITAQRAYELNSKVIQAGDEILQTLNQAKR
jgi:flagellar basal-body rod protein FlgG